MSLITLSLLCGENKREKGGGDDGGIRSVAPLVPSTSVRFFFKTSKDYVEKGTNEKNDVEKKIEPERKKDLEREKGNEKPRGEQEPRGAL